MAQVPFEAVIAPFIAPEENSSLRSLRLISIVNADLTITSKRGVLFKTSGAEFTFKRNRIGLEAFANAKIAYENYQSYVSAQFTKKKDRSIIDGEVTVSKLMPGTLTDLFAGNTLLNAMKFPISGKATLRADMDGALQKVGFVIDGGEGTIETDKLDGILPVSKLHAEGEVAHNTSDNVNTLTIKQFGADLQDVHLEAKGDVALHDHDPEVHAEVAITNVSADKVHLFWPPGLAPISREWVTANITEGRISGARAKLDIKPGDIAKPILPKEDVDAQVLLEGAKIRYLPEHPLVTAVKGSIHIDGMSLDAAIESAHYMKDTKLSEGRVYIADLNPDNPYIKIDLNAESTARDVIHLLELPPLKHAQRLNLKADEAEGKVKGHATLGFKFFAPRDEKGNLTDEPDVDFDIKGELSGVSQAGFMKKFDGKNVDGTMAIDNKRLEFTGKGEVNGAAVSEANVVYLFRPEDGFDTFIKATADAPVAVLPRFGYPGLDFLKGMLGVKAEVKEGKGIETTNATIDLTDAAVDLPSIHVHKPGGEKSSIELKTEKRETRDEGTAAKIPAFHFRSKAIDAQGEAELNKDLSGIKRVTMKKLVNGETELEHFFYERTDSGYIIEARGDTFDMEPWLNKKGEEPSDFSFAHFPSLQLKADVSHVLFGTDRELQKVKGTVDCNARLCESANIAGVTPDGQPFSFRILRNPKGRRQLSLHAQSAGVFLKSLDIFDGMQGGDLTIIGNYTEISEERKNSILRGRVDINEHTIKNANILAKILSLASLTGFFDTLQGKGIHFTRLNAPFTLTNDVITLEKARTYGDALGLTAEGTITYPSGAMDIQGTLVPSYTLNHVLGKVPLLGRIITGGEGEGVFAASFSIKGTQSDPKVSVNPLSILTPGFLRGLFDIFHAPPKKIEDDDEE